MNVYDETSNLRLLPYRRCKRNDEIMINTQNKLSHLDNEGQVRMVDISQKEISTRRAVASATISMTSNTLQMILDQKITKGNVFETARIAGIMAAKKTSDFIPMCHPLNLSHIQIDFWVDYDQNSIHIKGIVSVDGKTGVEMEALTAVSVSALTIYDMCKSMDREMMISQIILEHKSGGKSGVFDRTKSVKT